MADGSAQNQAVEIKADQRGHWSHCATELAHTENGCCRQNAGTFGYGLDVVILNWPIEG